LTLNDLASALLAEAQRFLELVSDEDRLHSEFFRECAHYVSAFMDAEDAFRKKRLDLQGHDKLLASRYLAAAEDLRISANILRGAIKYHNPIGIRAKQAEIRATVRRLEALITNGITDEKDRRDGIDAVARALGRK